MTGKRRTKGAEKPGDDALLEAHLRLGDDRLVLGHRLSEWCGHAPLLEEDIALANVALDLVGQATWLLERAAEIGGDGRRADDLAFFRDVTDYRNALLVEQPNGDFASTLARQFLFDAYDAPFAAALAGSKDAKLAGFGARAAKEAAYHLRHSREWVLRLGDGTEESHGRIRSALDDLWLFTAELFETDAATAGLVGAGILPDPAAIEGAWRATVETTLAEAGLPPPPKDAPARSGGRRGLHGEALGRMLDEMQSVARAHPGASW